MAVVPVKTRARKRDGAISLQAQCPGCGVWGEIDQEQLQSKISFTCPKCGFHGMIDGRKT